MPRAWPLEAKSRHRNRKQEIEIVFFSQFPSKQCLISRTKILTSLHIPILISTSKSTSAQSCLFQARCSSILGSLLSSVSGDGGGGKRGGRGGGGKRGGCNSEGGPNAVCALWALTNSRRVGEYAQTRCESEIAHKIGAEKGVHEIMISPNCMLMKSLKLITNTWGLLHTHSHTHRHRHFSDKRASSGCL